MQKNSTAYTFMFALAICVICSFTLSLVSEGLRPKKELNMVLDVKKNILKAVSLQTPLDAKATPDQVLSAYEEKIEELVIDKNGNVVEGKKPNDLKGEVDLYALYVYKENGQPLAYCFPVEGKGLWSTLYGYFALEADAITVRGMTFYKHGETPGLGAEIDKDWFQDNYKGKKIWDVKNNQLRPVAVIKGKVATAVSAEQAPYYVDGISGATMTAKGVTALVDRWVNIYEPFFAKIRKL
ncbi:Na(+)-translocating NADH-quinone reductase subunit C [hydrothermal vent metagenome]|uniref:Na(+)-translocating NADH-quinone reductase subunit C n=1 Tax=hydrothermal vent metagenome TaxID=652676 RepID=A0A3B1DGV1_9ZZZZ